MTASTEVDLELMRRRLLDLRRELESLTATTRQSSEVVVLDQSRVGRLSRMGAMQAQAMAQASGRRRTLMLQKIEAALTRIDNGGYGFCLRCEAPIHARRLQADPAATLCIDCASSAER